MPIRIVAAYVMIAAIVTLVGWFLWRFAKSRKQLSRRGRMKKPSERRKQYVLIAEPRLGEKSPTTPRSPGT